MTPVARYGELASRNLKRKGGNMMRKKLIHTVIAVTVSAFVFFSFMGVCKAAPKKITLKAVSAWPKNHPPVADDYLPYIKNLNKRLQQKYPGQLEIKYLGGPEVIPTRDQPEALRAGTVELYFGTDAYYAGIAPSANASKLTQITSWEERARGANAIFDEIHRKKLNSTYLGRLGSEIPFQLYLNVEVKTPDDLKGLRVRVSPMYIDFMKALSVTPIETKPGDVYQALERGVVDGLCWPFFGIRHWGWHEVVKYVVGPSFYKVAHPILVNVDKWNQIPEHLQKVLLDVLMEDERTCVTRDFEKIKNERELLKKAGMKFIDFSPSDTKRYYDLAYSSGWEAQIKKAPHYSEKLRKLLTK